MFNTLDSLCRIFVENDLKGSDSIYSEIESSSIDDGVSLVCRCLFVQSSTIIGKSSSNEASLKQSAAPQELLKTRQILVCSAWINSFAYLECGWSKEPKYLDNQRIPTEPSALLNSNTSFFIWIQYSLKQPWTRVYISWQFKSCTNRRSRGSYDRCAE